MEIVRKGSLIRIRQSVLSCRKCKARALKIHPAASQVWSLHRSKLPLEGKEGTEALFVSSCRPAQAIWDTFERNKRREKEIGEKRREKEEKKKPAHSHAHKLALAHTH
jgi:hypothetical protein